MAGLSFSFLVTREGVFVPWDHKVLENNTTHSSSSSASWGKVEVDSSVCASLGSELGILGSGDPHRGGRRPGRRRGPHLGGDCGDLAIRECPDSVGMTICRKATNCKRERERVCVCERERELANKSGVTSPWTIHFAEDAQLYKLQSSHHDGDPPYCVQDAVLQSRCCAREG